MNYQEGMAFLEGIAKSGSVLGLSSIKSLLFELENPEADTPCIHIAGTNGKGSTLAFISTILTTTGYQVGRYVSPTVFSYRERFQIDGVQISQERLLPLIIQVQAAFLRLEQKGLPLPTIFEVETAIAFLYFKEEHCDFAVIETGLGGDLDATNVISRPLLSVITPISRDHTDFLGQTLTAISEKKAGIIKEGCPVVCGPQEPEARKVLERVAKEKGAFLTFVDEEEMTAITYGPSVQRFSYGGYQELEIQLGGAYQITNGATALRSILVLREQGIKVSDEALREGLVRTAWPGRFSAIAHNPLVIIDGAHNQAAAKELAASLKFYFTNKRIIYIMGVLKDKDYREIIAATYSLAESIITVTPPGDRGFPAEALAQTVREYTDQVKTAPSVAAALASALSEARENDVIVAFGSLSYLGELTTLVEEQKKEV
ncbi:dihydrofolate synthase/folylpolyglutamate synthase [Lachnospiraceae bacterium PM6-15]|uniref:tetrahydrofolate synthase n=1 Tax=Ohessyouella blattaphilus TaxID=2949333 RepID=A0ABT1EGH8_9FIRM|nr:folylpolyglutamate synthase/dihydrofolate synthase family protein [Ohessyouella blattaphilus]MCP1109810.1 bifunctional folylpolyglutamate synthase/dihydrofolate synthase [Ohessyouella blattaphilus]MCR8563204.1 bifunctional folylpolyglutamate synthase/dihydrofolate synthase [Ohessyouella blattaphilus]